MIKRHQHIAELGSLLQRLGIRHVIICPGSRNAPLIQLFTSSETYQCHSIVDERSAGYVALGMARQLLEPVVVLTTSGTAVLNLAPAVAEAFHQQIPLLVISADRPPEKIQQFNNQIVDQQAPFYAYTRGFYQLPLVVHPEDLKPVSRRMEQLFASALSLPRGPVHMNILLEEPLYEALPPALDEAVRNTSPSVDRGPDVDQGPHVDFGKVDEHTKILVLVGMGLCNEALKARLHRLLFSCQAVVIAENIANMPGEDFISQPELLLAGSGEQEREALVPDLLITFGGQVVSKRLKLFLQKLEDLRHVELNENEAADPGIFDKLLSLDKVPGLKNQYLEHWKQGQEKSRLILKEKIKSLEYGNMWVIHAVLSAAPPGSVIHLGNSSTIRYSQLLPQREDLSYYSNRGTSGIDGCVSAAVGAAMVSELVHILLVGDLSFVYDSNALWNRNFPSRLKIVVVNDRGGGIFRLLKGPSDMDFFEEFSVAHHPASPALLARSFGREAIHVKEGVKLKEALSEFFTPGNQLSVLDVDTSGEDNSRIFKNFLDYSKQ